MMRAAIIVNPAKADVPAPWEQVDKTLAAGWSTPLWLETTPEDPGRGMAEAAVAAGVELVVICGGDGTVMGRLGALVGTDVPVAVVPLGTGNLLARNLGVSTRFADALAVAVNGVDRRIDLGRVGDQPFAVPPLRRLARTVLVGNVGRLQGGLSCCRTRTPTTACSTWSSWRRGRCATGSG